MTSMRYGSRCGLELCDTSFLVCGIFVFKVFLFSTISLRVDFLDITWGYFQGVQVYCQDQVCVKMVGLSNSRALSSFNAMM